ncbi:MAG: CcmD family protein [Candidatus Firestonebacteria bacterium]|nr:CcmD family protein [Candidatus Firestonebacteria bacterium]
MEYLFAAYTTVWIFLSVYIIFIALKQTKLNKELEILKKQSGIKE